jgi:hypothetical protein
MGQPVLNSPADGGYVEYSFVAHVGSYRLEVEYAASESRPVEITLNGHEVSPHALASVTGTGWIPGIQQKEVVIANLSIKEGENLLRLQSNHAFPYVLNLLLLPN